MIQKRDGSLYEGGSSGGGGTCLESAYILKVELTEFADGLGVGREKSKRIARFFDLRICQNEGFLY